VVIIHAPVRDVPLRTERRRPGIYNGEVKTSIRQRLGVGVLAAALVAAGATVTFAAEPTEVILASGKLDGRFLAGSLFHIDEFWIRVSEGTEFHRWLAEGLKHNVVVLLTTNPDRFGDMKNVRILSGTLKHIVAPKPTPVTTDVVGRLPEGDSGLVHELFLQDELTGSIGAVTFETADRVVASAFDVYDGTHISIVIAIDPPDKR
jgi:hypothetical protein